MADRLTIANAALSMIGEPVIRTMGENSPQTEAVKATLPIEIPAVLTTWPWDFSRREEELDVAFNRLVGTSEVYTSVPAIANALTYDSILQSAITVTGTGTIRRLTDGGADIATGTPTRPISLTTDGFHLYLALASGLWRMPIDLSSLATIVAPYALPGGSWSEPRGIAWADRLMYLVTDEDLFSFNPSINANLQRIGAHGLHGIIDMMFKPPHLFVVTTQSGGDHSIHLLNRITGRAQHVLRLPRTLAAVAGIEWDGTSLWLAHQEATSTAIYVTVPATVDLNRDKYFKPDDYLRVWNWPDAENYESRFLEDGNLLQIKPSRGGRGSQDQSLRYLISESSTGPPRPILAYVADLPLQEITDSLYVEMLTVRVARRLSVRFVESLQLRRELLIEEERLGNRVTAISLSQRDSEEPNVNDLGRPGVRSTHDLPSRGGRDRYY